MTVLRCWWHNRYVDNSFRYFDKNISILSLIQAFSNIPDVTSVTNIVVAETRIECLQRKSFENLEFLISGRVPSNFLTPEFDDLTKRWYPSFH